MNENESRCRAIEHRALEIAVEIIVFFSRTIVQYSA